jgi:hypothetical protein
MTRPLVLLLLTLGATLSAADLSGSWTLSLDPDLSGNLDTLECTLKQSGSTLALVCGGGPEEHTQSPPIPGDVQGKNVKFAFQTGAKGDETVTMAGVLDQPETTINGTWRLAPENETGKFQLTKK